MMKRMQEKDYGQKNEKVAKKKGKSVEQASKIKLEIAKMFLRFCSPTVHLCVPGLLHETVHLSIAFDQQRGTVTDTQSSVHI